MELPPNGREAMRTRSMAEELAALVRRAREGDERAFERLVVLHHGRVHGVLHRLVGNHEDAEDLAQECFVRAHRALGSFRGEGSFEGWLVRIAVHLARDHGRRRGPALPLEAGPEPAAPGGPQREADRREFLAVLERAVQRLPEALRVALVLRVLEGLDYAEVARATGVRPATVRTQVMKARRLLLRHLGPWIEPWLGEEEAR